MHDHIPKQTQSIDQEPNKEAIRLGPDLRQWNERTEDLMAQNTRIIAFRGAGTVNGIEPSAAQNAVNTLRDYIDQVTADGTPVALMYDGDGDDRTKPDVGSVFGSLVDALGDNSHVTHLEKQDRWLG